MNRRPRSKPKRQPKAAPKQEKVADEQRLQKVLATAGIGSRRECEELILEGRVEVDRKVVSELGVRVDSVRQEIRVDGVVLTRPKLIYYAVNKPVGVVCTNSDPSGRTRVVDLIKTDERLFTVGRLDRTSEGLILVTNDGQLTNRLTHPRYGVSKTYLVRVAGHPTREELDALRRGVYLAEGVARVASIRVKRRYRQQTELEMVLSEGRNREIRRLLARIGHKVVKLQRIAIGHLRLHDLPLGAYRKLTREDIRRLFPSKESTAPKRAAPKGKRGPAKRAAGKKASTSSPKESRKRVAGSVKGTVLSYDDDAPRTRSAKPKAGKRKSAKVTPARAKSAKAKFAKTPGAKSAKRKSAKPSGKGKPKKGRR